MSDDADAKQAAAGRPSKKRVSAARYALMAERASDIHGEGPKWCILAGSRPGFIKLCPIDPHTGACSGDGCKEFKDPGSAMLAHITGI
jgi:hypothetical protein